MTAPTTTSADAVPADSVPADSVPADTVPADTVPADAAQVAAVRVDKLLEQLRCGADPRAAVVAEELVRCLVQLYGAGLSRVVSLVGPETTAQLCADPLVESLLLVHDLHPADPETRIRQALERLRPQVGAVELLGIDDAGIVHLRLPAGESGCGSSGSAARLVLETNVAQAAPELAGVEVVVPAPAPPLLQVSRRPGLPPPAQRGSAEARVVSAPGPGS